jgi:hypothetical protein
MANYANGKFTPKNPQKYIGKHVPNYRSGWEFVMMKFLDSNPHVLQWASEAISIPYIHPITGKRKNYIPDFFVVYRDKTGKQIAEMIEVKPKRQSVLENNMGTPKEKAIVAINHAKWEAAQHYCQRNGFNFRVITESDIFHNGKK